MNAPNLSKKATILVVDDAADNLALMSDLLKNDYQVKIANSGEKALKIAMSDSPPDLILLDIMMPGMDGFEVCQQLKRDPRTTNILVMFVTAKAEVEDEKKGLELGAIDYITKPISPPIVLARVKNHLALKAMADFLRNQNNWDTAERLAHTLKGLTGNIGLGSLQPLAEKLELAIKSRRSHDEVDARIDGPTRIAELARGAEEQGRPSATDNRKKLEAVCNQLESLLLAGDVGAVDVMDANAELLDAAFPHHCHEIDNNIRAFDFEAALAALRTVTAKPA